MTVVVAADGSAQVQERLVVTFVEPTSEFRWRAPAWRHDGVSDVTASMDGAAFRPGDGAGRLVIGRGPDLDVRWTFAPIAGAHVFGLSYRASNAVHLSGIRGSVLWRVLAPTNDVGVRIAVAVPESAVLLQDPWVEEPGFKVTRERHAMTAEGMVSGGDSATAGIEFTVDRMKAARPQWQTDSERAVQFVPAFISAALFILVIAVGVLWMLRMKYPNRRAPVADDTPRNIGTARTLWRATRRSGPSLEPGLIADDLIDRERVLAARDLWRAGIATIVLGALAWAVTRWTLAHYGAWPLVVPLSVVVAGVVFLVGAARFPVLSEAGSKARVLYCARISDGRIPE